MRDIGTKNVSHQIAACVQVAPRMIIFLRRSKCQGWTNQLELPAARASLLLLHVHVGWTLNTAAQVDELYGIFTTGLYIWNTYIIYTWYASRTLFHLTKILCLCIMWHVTVCLSSSDLLVKFIVINRSYCGGVPLGDIGTRRFCSPCYVMFSFGNAD